ncbi:hypothetical protein K438DRAFT_1763900 [Mycena galopus ATCC 62051]|nr:hypothetical protein K438DRAFT_1763900 [Mycena galopus ATCC 62051]
MAAHRVPNVNPDKRRLISLPNSPSNQSIASIPIATNKLDLPLALSSAIREHTYVEAILDLGRSMLSAIIKAGDVEQPCDTTSTGINWIRPSKVTHVPSIPRSLVGRNSNGRIRARYGNTPSPDFPVCAREKYIQCKATRCCIFLPSQGTFTVVVVRQFLALLRTVPSLRRLTPFLTSHEQDPDSLLAISQNAVRGGLMVDVKIAFYPTT